MKTVASSVNTTNAATEAAADTSPANTTAAPTAVVLPKTEPLSTADEALQFQTPNTTATAAKRPASLDLNKSAKKRALFASTPLVIDSPEPQNNKTLSTPDLEMLITSNLLQTPQPGTVFPTKTGPITSEQEAFGKGFEEALHSLHTSKNSQALNASATITNTTTTATITAVNNGMSGGSFTYTNMDNFPVIKDEPHNSNASPPVSPIDMETQEKIKLERKRQRNRVAASKCRKRKLERISKLEDKVKMLKGENSDLGMVVKSLKDHVAQLKQQVMEHMDAGCNITHICNGASLLGK